ncbi:L-aspartate oxidase [Ralstonia pseudosolanacearum]|uniref:L-aspartate oxidase 2 n=1 Tax=Ralstonia nicotianae (strain ATCC BAA-1114 / GMI1000) TaxID=267608 RepID=NADB2_RALN1|nr:L-aspartate oxidase [Ralstonia pseudosolanacearum]Q8XQG4.1 RecName: Full=L-aspartate oxidase 2; Short=LASPO 2; AltName: Full=Quinolinate synthase B 2 [Ralstonia pseudosolanacearum GMI1000]AST30226.1 L-aspartate oxidase [Ralstonia pseudosolanacearum]CAD18414.1 probable l-aspartate oxidase 2 (laspo 2) (quinolinate synthetaseb 2). oxidoreductase protein [Ralstonia pseudosolanacearum GMI1000]
MTSGQSKHEIRDMKFDVLVVGEGLAALTLLLHLPPSLKIGVISRNKYDEPSSYWAQGGISAVFSTDDDHDKHIRDTLLAGDGLCDEAAVRQIVCEGGDVLRWLIDQGVPFTREDGEIHLTREGGHSERRVAHVDDMTGRGIMRALQAKVAQLPNVIWIRQYEAVELLSDGQAVSGVIAESLADGEVTVFSAPTVVLAAGGLTGLYQYATNPHASKGEAIAMAWRAGATIENLEFVQFHPTAFQIEGRVISLITEAVRGEGGLLYNVANERFMPGYSSQQELAPRDVVARAIYSEMQAHGTSHVWLDITHQGTAFVEQHFPNLVEITRAHGCDLSQHRVPVSPAAHYTCGGIGADVAGRTNIEGLYAIGEVANCGLHGANRLASNSLLECVVMGKACAQSVTDTAGSASRLRLTLPERIETPFHPNLLADLRAILWNHAGIVRSNTGLEIGLQNMAQLQERHASVLPYGQALRAQNIFDAAHLVLLSAAARKESRGGHFNKDHADKAEAQTTQIPGVPVNFWAAGENASHAAQLAAA